MIYEVEQKFRIDDADAVERVLLALGANLAAPLPQSDTYFSHPNRDFGNTDEALRLRDDGMSKSLTYKGPRIDLHTKTRRELELVFPAGEEFWTRLRELLGLLGFGVVVEVRKQRRIARVAWENADVEVAFDKVEHLGCFVELELKAEEQDVPVAREKIASLAKSLGLVLNERRSYCEMLLTSSVIRSAEIGDEGPVGQSLADRANLSPGIPVAS